MGGAPQPGAYKMVYLGWWTVGQSSKKLILELSLNIAITILSEYSSDTVSSNYNFSQPCT